MLVQVVIQFIGIGPRVTGQGMHDHGIGLAVTGVDCLVKPKSSAIDVRLQFGVETLFLNASQVYRIVVLQTPFHFLGFRDLVTGSLQV